MLISSSDYESLVGHISNARSVLDQPKEYMFDAVYEIVLLDEIYPEVDMLNDFWTSYQASTDVSTPPALILATGAMQQHVLNRGGYSDINDYYAEYSIYVDATFASVSESAGYPVEDAWIS